MYINISRFQKSNLRSIKDSKLFLLECQRFRSSTVMAYLIYSRPWYSIFPIFKQQPVPKLLCCYTTIFLLFTMFLFLDYFPLKNVACFPRFKYLNSETPYSSFEKVEKYYEVKSKMKKSKISFQN